MKIETSNGCILEFEDDDIAEQVLRHKPGWKEVSGASPRKSRKPPDDAIE